MFALGRENSLSRELLIMAEINGSNSSVHCFKSHVGRGSSSHDLLLKIIITVWISCCDDGLK